MNKPQTLKGFRDFYGDELRLRKTVFAVFENLFKQYGFEALETPTLEYAEVLLDKYGEDEKLVYRFKDSGDRDVAMRYDLTVPTARVLTQHQNDLTLPWKRYQIQPVWRADNTQRGRYREFYQLDVDVFGADSMLVEAELMLIGNKALSGLGFNEYRVRLNNRKILNAVADYSGHPDKFTQIVTAIDKWDKRSLEETQSDLLEILHDKAAVDRVIEVASLTGTNSELLEQLEKILGDNEQAQEGINELKRIVTICNDPSWIQVDMTIARGLAYYTGPIWEWEITEGNIGSVGAGGRYNGLVKSLGGPDIPASGTSFGIERLVDLINERGMDIGGGDLGIDVLVTVFDDDNTTEAVMIAEELREKGLAVVVYPQIKKLSKQLEYADKKQIPVVLIAGENEIKDGQVLVKNMNSGSQETVSRKTMAEFIGRTLTNR